MAPLIGTATSRIDGHAKVTGAAKYAAEHDAPDLTHGSVVASTIARGRIARLDASEALRVPGVIDVLWHENRPQMAATDRAYKDDVAPGGSPFRPLYDDRVLFNGQPIALVVAEDAETAQFAASLVRVDYEAQEHVTDLQRRRDQTIPADAKGVTGLGRDGVRRRRGAPRGRIRGPDRAPQPDGALRLDRDPRAGRDAHGLRQDPGRPERAALRLQRARPEAGRGARAVAVHGRRLRLRAAAAMPGRPRRARGAGGGAPGAGRAHAPADVRGRLPAGDDPADRARRHRRRDARLDRARCRDGDLALRSVRAAGDRLVGPALQEPQRVLRPQARSARPADGVRHACAGRRERRLRARVRDGRARGRAPARPRRAAAALLFGPRPGRGPALQQQEAARLLPPGRRGVRLGQAQPRAAHHARRQGSGRLGHGDRRLGSPADADLGAHRTRRQRPCRGVVRDLRHRHRHLHHHGAGRGRAARAAARRGHDPARRLDPAPVPGRRRVLDRGLGVERDRDDRPGHPRRAVARCPQDAGLADGGGNRRRRSRSRTAGS